MRITRINQIPCNYSFKGVRKDINTIKELKYGTAPIGENQKLNIYTALQNIAANPTNTSIKALLDTARNRAYGIDEFSEYSKSINPQNTDNKQETQNTNWETILNQTLISASETLEKNNGDKDLIEEVKQYTSSPVYKELSPVQKEILDLRKRLNTALKKQYTKEFPNKTKAEKETELKDLDENFIYLLTSSETTYDTKKECLKKFLYLLGNKYEINPDLENKKIQIIKEMLADMLVKTPKSKVLTTKGIDQRQSGICAAISICRKLLAYEDKSRYMDVVLDELSNNPYMEVYDITDLDSGKKVPLEKPFIDYEEAISRGYRILDASAHIWMQNAHASGNGTLQTEWYTAFDSINNGIFDDTSWFGYITDKYAEKDFLKAIIQEIAFIEKAENTNKKKKELKEQAYKLSKNFPLKDKTSAELLKILRQVFPSYNPSQINEMEKNLIKYYNGYTSDNEEQVPKKLPKEAQEQRIKNYILENDNADKEVLEKDIEKIYSYIQILSDCELKIKQAKNYNSPSGKFRYYQTLFNTAKAHRNAIEADITMPNYKLRYEKMSELPPQDLRLSDYLHNLTNKVDNSCTSELQQDIKFINNLHSKIDYFLGLLFNENLKSVLILTYSMAIDAIKSGDTNTQDTIANISLIDNDKDSVIEYINKILKELEQADSSDTEVLCEAARILGYSSILSCFNDTISSFNESIQQNNGIQEETYNKLITAYKTDDLNEIMKNLSEDINYLSDKYNQIISKWHFPSSTSLILKFQEKDNEILSNDDLNYLYCLIKSKKESILNETEHIKNPKEKQKATNKLINFTPKEEELYAKIESQLTHMRKYAKRNYKFINSLLAKEMEEQYSYIGKLNGQYWVREEGSTGLLSNEQLRIIEQMTGKSYHIETDLDKAINQIKEGKGSGILSSSMDDSDYAFHAQYITDVSPVKMRNPKTGDTEEKDILWTDNSWGEAEKEYWWNNEDTGLEYTDYGNGYGWKDGFIVDDSYKIGLMASDLKYASGVAKKYNETFGLVNDIILPGVPINSHVKLIEMLNDIFAIEKRTHAGYLQALDDAISKNNENISPDFLEQIDKLVYQKSEAILKRIKKEIKSKEDYEKLPDNDPLKLILKKLSVSIGVSNNKGWSEAVYYAKTPEELEQIKKDAFTGYLNLLKLIVNKSDIIFDQIYKIISDDIDNIFNDLKTNYKLNISPEEINRLNEMIFEQDDYEQNWDGSYDDLQEYLFKKIDLAAQDKIFDNKNFASIYYSEKMKNLVKETLEQEVKIKTFSSSGFSDSEFKHILVKAIDRYYNPETDEDVLNTIKKLQNSDRKSTQAFFDSVTEEDLGLKYPDPYDCIRMLNAENNFIERRLDKIITSDIIMKNIRVSNEEEPSSADELYRALYIALADMDIQRHVRTFKAEALQKYKLRQAFPKPVVLKEENIQTNIESFLNLVDMDIESIKINKDLNKLLSAYKKHKDSLDNNFIFNAWLEGRNISYDENSEAEINEIMDFIEEIYSIILSNEKQLKRYINPDLIKEFLDIIYSSDEEPDTNQIQDSLTKIINQFENYMETGSIETTEQGAKDTLNSLRENMSAYINGSVELKYRNGAYQRLKNYIREYMKDSESDKTKQAEEIFTDFAIYRHITKNPVCLLNEVVKDIKSGNDIKNKNAFNLKKQYLLMALNIAEQTKIQYDLVENQHNGISSKFKVILPYHNLLLKDGSQKNLLSSEGLSYLIYQLANEADNYETLKLFLDQTGLSAQAIKSLTAGFNLNKSVKYFDKALNQIVNDYNDIDFIDKLTEKFIHQDNPNFSSMNEALKTFINYMTVSTLPRKNSKIIKNYLKALRTSKIVKETNISDNDFILNHALFPLSSQILSKQRNEISQSFNNLRAGLEVIDNQANLASEITIPEQSQAFKDKQEYFRKYFQFKQYTTEKFNQFAAEKINSTNENNSNEEE